MKFAIMFVVVLALAGCTHDNPVQHLIQDQEFAGYKETLDQLEKDYLRKRITYADYLQKKQQVDEEYQKQIETRRHQLENSRDNLVEMEMGQ